MTRAKTPRNAKTDLIQKEMDSLVQDAMDAVFKPKRSRKRKSTWWVNWGRFAAMLIASCVMWFFVGRTSVHHTIIQIANQATGDWTRLDLSKYPRVSLFCGTPVGGYACSVNRVQPDMDKDAGTGILLVPYVNESVPDTPPAGSSHTPDSQKQREHSDSFSTRNLRAAR